MMKKELTIISDKSRLAERKLMPILLCVAVTCYSQVPHNELGVSSFIAKTLTVYGSPGRARTADLMINSHPLYRLSYRGMRRNLKLIPLVGQEGLENILFLP